MEEWREQRRKKFPSKQVREEKEAREQQLREAGGLVQEKGLSGEKKRGRREQEQQHEGGGLKKVKVGLEGPESEVSADMGEGISTDQLSNPVTSVVKKKQCLVFKKKGRCKFGDKCHFSHDSPAKGEINAKNRNNAKNKDKKGVLEKGSLSSLYGKLVVQEREKEDNMILQCFRYFVQSDFCSRTPAPACAPSPKKVDTHDTDSSIPMPGLV